MLKKLSAILAAVGGIALAVLAFLVGRRRKPRGSPRNVAQDALEHRRKQAAADDVARAVAAHEGVQAAQDKAEEDGDDVDLADRLRDLGAGR